MTLYDAGDADILSPRGGMFFTRGGESEQSEWRFFVSRKVSLKTIRSRSRVLVSLFLLFFSNRFLFFVLVYVWVTFDFTTPPTKRRRLFSQKSLHIISHLIIIITRDIKRTREELFRAFQRERVLRCAAEQQQLLFHFFLNIVLSRARACIIYTRRARFNHPSHGAALSHVVVMIAQKNTRTTSPFSRERRRDEKKNIAKENAAAVVCRAR